MPVVSVIEVKEKQIRQVGSRQEVNVSYVIITYSLVSKGLVWSLFHYLRALLDYECC